MPLKKAEIAKFKERLEEMRDKLTHQYSTAAVEVQTPDEATGYSQHQADEGTDDFDRTISIELTTKEQELLRQILRALEKIQDGTYGVCDISGDEIPRARLDVMPYACTTVAAQEKLEKGLL